MPSGEHSNLVGIDLGTTLSVIARLDRSGSAVTIPNRRGDPLTPSVVYLDGTTARVGETARIAAARDSSKAAVSVKREMGTSLDSRTVDGRRLRPETLSAIILRKLKQDAERQASRDRQVPELPDALAPAARARRQGDSLPGLQARVHAVTF